MKNLKICLGMLVTLVSCASGTRPISIALDPLSAATTLDRGSGQDLQRLRQFLKKNPADQVLVADVLHILEAIEADKKGDFSSSAIMWRSALETARDALGERAFNGWLKAYVRVLGRKVAKVDLARMILKDTRSGSLVPWMIERQLVTEDKLLPLLVREVPEALESEAVTQELTIDAPPLKGVPGGDPLMSKLASDVCAVKARYGNGWVEWRRSLQPDVEKYFDALVAQCSGQQTKAVSVLSDIAPRLASQGATASLALESFARMIKIRRDQGERESVAPLYVPFMQLWKNPAVNEHTLGLTRSVFESRRIDDTLWAARSRASIGDGEAATGYAEDVLSYVGSALAQSYTLSQERKNALIAIASETYHLLAFRLAVEEQNWDKAYHIAETGLEQGTLPDEWSFRLRWSQGIYRYLAEDYEEARAIWEGLLTDAIEPKVRPMLLFWVSQAHLKMGHAAEAGFYRKSLVEDFPLSYYSVVALKLSPGAGSEDDWQKAFNDVPALRRSIGDWQKADIEDLRSDENRGPKLRRAEILIATGIAQYGVMSLDDLQKTFDPASGTARHANWGLYLSRLYAAAGHWLGSISLTTKLTKNPDFWREHPEQMLAYFPRPHLTTFEDVARESGLESQLLMGISRQESSFRADAKSGANAWGLMQITPPTARRLLNDAGFTDPSSVSLPDSLLKPEVSIRMGSALVRELNGRYDGQHAAVFAAYNAGAQTVEHWISRRIFADPLVFIEMIPYQETRDYVKGVWRNELVYGYLAKETARLSIK
jgi:hypothetical protein